MNRRGFLSSCLTLAAAPAIVRADSLMRIVPREAAVILPAATVKVVNLAARDAFVGILFQRFDDLFYRALMGNLPDALSHAPPIDLTQLQGENRA